jgi:hypothetical protein
MAKNKIQIDVMVNGKMEKATVSSKKLKKALDGAKTSQDQLNTSTRQGYRAAQGTAQNTANSTKAFAKQAGVVGGLVPIYATFAANVFAISAAFGVLSRNAAVQQLESSLNNIGISAGRNLPQVAQNLKEITNSAISTEAALRATAIATTSGFSTSQLQGLTKVATGASIALGRDLNDALDRLVRGTAKLEPEILDELGIIVRLDDATREYASTIGKTAQELTTFERTQAFLNATIDQGLNKYEKIAMSVDPNPYDKLRAAFDDLAKSGLALANNVLTPLVKLLSNNTFALTGALLLFGNTLVNQIVPALDEVIAKNKDLAKASAAEARKANKAVISEYQKGANKLKTISFAPKVAAGLIPQIKAGKASIKEIETAILSLKRSEDARNAQAIGNEKARTAAYKAQTQELILQRQALEGLKTAERTRTGTTTAGQQARTTSRLARRTASYSTAIGNAGALGGFGIAFRGIGQNIKELGKAEAATGALAKTTSKLGKAAKVGASSFTLFGRAALNAVPVIGQLLFFGSLLLPLFSKAFGATEAEKAVKKAQKSFSNFAKIVIAFRKEMETTEGVVRRTYRSLEVAAGLADQTASAFNKLSEDLNKINTEKLSDRLDILIKQRDALASKRASEIGAANFLGRDFNEDEFERQNKVLVGSIRNNETAIEKLLDSFDKIKKSDAILVLAKNISVLENSGAFKTFPKLEKEFGSLLEEIQRGGDNIDAPGLVKKIEKLSEPFRKLESAVKASGEAIRGFDTEVNKLKAKDVTPFDGAIRQLETLQREFSTATRTLADNIDRGLQTGTPLRNLEKFSKNIDFSFGLNDILQTETPSLIVKPRLPIEQLEPELQSAAKRLGEILGKEFEFSDQFESALDGYLGNLDTLREKLLESKSVIADQEEILKRINNVVSMGAGFVGVQIEQEKEVKKAKVAALNIQKDLNLAILGQRAGALANVALSAQIQQIQNSINDENRETYRLKVDEVKVKQEALNIVKRTLDAEKESANIAQKRFDLDAKSAERLASRERFSFLTADEDTLKRQIASVQNQIQLAQSTAAREAELKKQTIALEYMLLDAKYRYLEAESRKQSSDLAEQIANPKEGADLAALREAKRIADESTDRIAGLRTGLGAKDITINLKTGKIEGIQEGSILERLFGNIDANTKLEVDQLAEKLLDLKTQLADMDVVEQALDAAAKSFADGFGKVLAKSVDGIKSMKEAFIDLGKSIVQTLQKIFLDAATEKFLGVLSDLVPDDSVFSRLFKKKQVEGTKASGAGGVAASGSSAVGGISSPEVSMGAVDMFAPGHSAGNPLYVTIVDAPTTDLSPGVAEAAGLPTAEAPESSGTQESTKATEESTKETKKLTLETAKAGLQTASMVTAGLATVAALTGNEKAARALAVVTALLQAATIALTIATNINTAGNIFGFRRGGIASPDMYSTGGIAKGSQSGYPALLHGTEAVVPLPNGKSIPVEMSGSASGGGMQQNNISVNVSVSNEGNATSQVNGQDASGLGKSVAAAVQRELQNQKRPGGMLSPYGVA